eukprot:g17180.t1
MATTTSSLAQEAMDDPYRPVRIWLWCVAVLVFLMVFVGGATRLTDSGLSITEWRPITGIIPPLSAEGWEAELEKYRQIPEYQRINRGMSMSEFQFIYWWEWGHRFLGRMVGFAFALPLVWFAARKALPPGSMPKLLGLMALGGLQGFIGWWMVASGLTERVDVSQYRLSVHLTMAAIILAAIIWVAQGMKPLEAGLDQRRDEHANGAGFAGLLILFVLFQIFLGAAFKDRKMAGALALAVAIQAVIGIITLITQVEMEWALFHQFWAFVLLGLTVLHRARLTGHGLVLSR